MFFVNVVVFVFILFILIFVLYRSHLGEKILELTQHDFGQGEGAVHYFKLGINKKCVLKNIDLIRT